MPKRDERPIYIMYCQHLLWHLEPPYNGILNRLIIIEVLTRCIDCRSYQLIALPTITTSLEVSESPVLRAHRSIAAWQDGATLHVGASEN